MCDETLSSASHRVSLGWDGAGFARIPIERTALLLSCYSSIQLKGGIHSDSFWLKWNNLDLADLTTLRSIPDVEFFRPSLHLRLIREGDLLPSTEIPKINWRSIKELFSLDFPTTAYPAQSTDPLSVSLIRSGKEQPSSVLRTTIENWERFCLSSAEIRLQPLRFAASHSGKVVIQGTPLPGEPGEQFALDHGVAIRSGWKLWPVGDQSSLNEQLALSDGDLALIEPVSEPTEGLNRVQAQVTVIPLESFVVASRSAARDTASHVRMHRDNIT